MNAQRFVGRNAREAMALARAACGEDAIVLSNRPVPGGVEILAIAGEPIASPAPPALPAPAEEPRAMSTVSFQDYVRERQRHEAVAARQAGAPAPEQAPPAFVAPRAPVQPAQFAREELARDFTDAPLAAPVAAPGGDTAVMEELRSLRTSLTRQLSSFAWFDRARRSPAQTRLLRLLLANGFSPALARSMVQRLPDDTPDAQAESWLLAMLAHNLRASTSPIQEHGGVYALVGPTGVGKTTTTAKIAAAFALKHGAASVGLITVDTYRLAATDQLRAFGRILGIPVHTARDAPSLSDLLDLLKTKKLVLVDTVGVGQRDRRLPELFAALPAARLQRLLVLNAAANGETLEEVVRAYSPGPGARCVLSKLDEAARCGGFVDVALRHQLQIEGIASGQRVPEDWHALRPTVLAHKALLQLAGRFQPGEDDLGLLLTMPPAHGTQGIAHA